MVAVGQEVTKFVSISCEGLCDGWIQAFAVDISVSGAV